MIVCGRGAVGFTMSVAFGMFETSISFCNLTKFLLPIKCSFNRTYDKHWQKFESFCLDIKLWVFLPQYGFSILVIR